MIVRISIFDTIINLYKPYIMDNCIKIVSKIQFLTFCGGIKIKKELNLSDLALYLCCLGSLRSGCTRGIGSRRCGVCLIVCLYENIIKILFLSDHKVKSSY